MSKQIWITILLFLLIQPCTFATVDQTQMMDGKMIGFYDLLLPKSKNCTFLLALHEQERVKNNKQNKITSCNQSYWRQFGLLENKWKTTLAIHQSYWFFERINEEKAPYLTLNYYHETFLKYFR